MPLLVPRFPVLAEWYFQLGVRCGYTEAEAFSLALARARAINIQPTFTARIETPKSRFTNHSTIEVSTMFFIREYVPITIRPDGKLRGIYFKDNLAQLCQPDLFDSIVKDRLKADNYRVISKALTELSDCFSVQDLNKYGPYLWELFAPLKSNGSKPERGEIGQLYIERLKELTDTFKLTTFKPIDIKVNINKRSLTHE